jgi:hypothetical protein
MDTGKGKFEMLSEGKLESLEMDDRINKVFRVGELIPIKQSLFKVLKITPKKLILRLLPREETSTSRSLNISTEVR